MERLNKTLQPYIHSCNGCFISFKLFKKVMCPFVCLFVAQAEFSASSLYRCLTNCSILSNESILAGQH